MSKVNKNLLLLFLIYIIPFSGFSQLTLDSCQVKAMLNYPLINQFDLIEQSKQYSLSNANKSYLPQLDVNLIAGVVDGMPTISVPGQPEADPSNFQFITMLQLNQVIWDGGITRAQKSIIEASSDIEKAELEVSLYGLEDRINNLFFGVLLIEEQIKQLEILKSTLERNMKRVEVAVENGTAFKSDIDELKVELLNVGQRVDELTYNRLAYLNVLSLMIGEAIPASTHLERPVALENYSSLQLARPELKVFNNQLALLEAKSRKDKSMLYPKIGIMAFSAIIQPGVEFGTSTIENVLVAGLSVNWSLGSLYRNSNNKKLTEVNISKVNLRRETFLFNTNLNLSQVSYDLGKYEKLIEKDRDILALKSSIRKSYDVKYENGISTMSDLLDKVNDEILAKQQLIMHEIQYLMKLYDYKNKSGN